MTGRANFIGPYLETYMFEHYLYELEIFLFK